MIGGFNKIFEIGKNFRNEGFSPRHNPEFTSLELYEAFGSYASMMTLLEKMLCHFGLEYLGFGGKAVGDFNYPSPWRRVTMSDLVAESYSASVDWTPEEKHKYYEDHIEHTLIAPTFVTHLPASVVPLAKESSDFPGYAECFEFVVNGMELAPGYTEQNNPDIQRRVFQEQSKQNNSPVDEDFLQAMMYGMPPAGGIGLGIDRLVMLMAGVNSIKDIILFPMTRGENDTA